MPENIASPPTSDKELLVFLHYLEIIAKGKKLIVTVTLAGFALSIGCALLLPRIYSSTARILPPQQDPGLASLMLGQMGGGGGLSSLAGSVLGAATPADQYASILQSERVKNAIIDRFKLMELYRQQYRLDMYLKMDSLVEIKAGKKDGIITIRVEDEDPKRAAAIANAYVEELGKLTSELSISSAGQNRAFLEGRLAGARLDLARAEEAMTLFQVRSRAVNVPEQAKASIEGIAGLKAQIAAQEAQLSGMRSQFTDSTPEVQTLTASIGKLKAQAARLEGKGTGAIPSLGSVPGLGQEQIRLLREFKTQEMIVELLTRQNELAKLTEAKNISSIQVLQHALVPDKKVKPKRSLIVLGSTFFSFLASVGWILLGKYRERFSADEVAGWRRVTSALGWRRSGN
jgi:tyrosine-protein kinase Etk/Wzc